jgi:hypothetical protein
MTMKDSKHSLKTLSSCEFLLTGMILSSIQVTFIPYLYLNFQIQRSYLTFRNCISPSFPIYLLLGPVNVLSVAIVASAYKLNRSFLLVCYPTISWSFSCICWVCSSIFFQCSFKALILLFFTIVNWCNLPFNHGLYALILIC